MSNKKIQGQPFLSIIIPAFNEEQRLPASLKRVVAFAERQNFTTEIIIVDNASTDLTREAIIDFTSRYPFIKYCYEPSRGKGAAVRTGILASRGDYLLICDADLSVPIEEVSKFLPPPLSNYDIAIASRQIEGAKRMNEPFHRYLISRLFNFVVRILILRGIYDTQCGFKCFRREIAHSLFKTSTIDGWSFDVEILYNARLRDCKIVEVPVNWNYVNRSKVVPFKDSQLILKEIMQLRRERTAKEALMRFNKNADEPRTGKPAEGLISVRYALAIIAVLWSLFFITGISQLPLMHKDEPRYASVAEEMLEHGDFMTPTLENKPWFEKPPLSYWLIVLSYKAFGVSDWASRIPSLVLTLVVMLLLFQFARKEFGTDVGLLSVAICSTFVHFWIMGRAVAPEIALVASETATLYFMYYGIEEHKKHLVYLGYVCMGIAFLAKGPVGIIIPTGILFFHYLLRGNLVSALKCALTPVGILLFALVGLPWYLLMIKQYGYPFIREFFLVHNIDRFTGLTRQHPFKFYYYVPIFLGSLYLWLPFIPELWTSVKETMRDRGSDLLFLLWFAFPFLFFTISFNKLHNYIMIVYPAVAVLLARTINKVRLIRFSVKSLFVLFGIAEVFAIPFALSRFPANHAAIIAGGSSLLVLSLAIIFVDTTLKRAVSLLIIKGFTILMIMLALLHTYAKNVERAYAAVNRELSDNRTTVMFYKKPRYDFWFYSDKFFPTVKNKKELDRVVEEYKEIVLIVRQQDEQSLKGSAKSMLISFNDLGGYKWDVIKIKLKTV